MRYHFAVLIVFLVVNASRVVDPLEKIPRPDRKGIILFSEGRSATLSISDSFVSSNLNVKYCFDRKESFRTKKVTDSTLSSCFAKEAAGNNSIMFTHIKPGHIETVHNLKFTTVINFINSAYTAGFNVLVANRRDNALAREISSFELFEKNLLAKVKMGNFSARLKYEKRAFNHFNDRGLRGWHERFQRSFAIMELAKYRAKGIGMSVVSTDFVELVHEPCAVSRRIGEALLHEQFINTSTLAQLSCVASALHTSSNSQFSLEDRIGYFAAKILRENMVGTQYEWMLNLSRSTWPEDIRPCKDLKLCLDSESYYQVKDVESIV